MTTHRPWWLWLATASLVSYFLFLNFALHYSRQAVGFSTNLVSEGVVVSFVGPGSAAERAGMRVGDRLVTAGELPIEDQIDFIALQAAQPIGTPTEYLVDRAGVPVRFTVEPLHRRWVMPSAAFVVVGLSLLTSVSLGILLAWRGDGRPVTLLAACLLGGIGCASVPLFPRSMGFMWAELPLPLGLLLWPAAISSIFAPVLMFTFCALVPRPVLPTRWLIAALVPITGVVLYVTVSAILIIYDPVRVTALPIPTWFQMVGPLSYGVYFGASAAMLVVSLRRVTDLTERRRVQTLLAGTVLGGIGLFVVGGGFAIPALRPQIFTTIGAVIFSVLPVAFAYATLRHRLFDLRVIVRLGLQYALARGFVLALIPIAVAVFVIDLLRHSEQPLRQILASRGWSYAAFAGVIGLIYLNRQPWMTALDRRFFRERYAAQQILRDVVQDVTSATDFRAAAGKVVSRVDSALHPKVVAVLMKPKSSTAFTPVTTVPATHGVPELPSGGSITQVVRALGRPVAFGASGLGDVPADQQRWLSEASVELVVPIATEASRDEAVLVLGPRRSEEPYSKEDLDLLSAIGASLGMLMGRESAQAETIAVSSGGGSGKNRIADRYRIERPIGEGGMGVVFAAVDETLDRPVAIKVIKDHLLGADGRSRFQREARTAASLSHPHIVTVHDFGVDDAGSPYLVMELLEGRSLRVAIRSEGRMPAARALPIVAGIAAAVDAAHAKGVVHRDLKPENVFLVGNTTHAKVLDYGIAKAMAGTTSATTGGVIGSIPYMAPEQAAGGPVSPAWDVWSVSVIAYELLTGAHPFGGGLPITTAAPIRSLAPDLSDEIAGAIDSALILDPSKRPPYAVSAILRS